MKLQKLYNEYKEAQKATDKLETAMLEDFENEEIEAEFDRCYQKEHNLWKMVVEEIINLTNATFEVAKRMLASDDFENLMKMNIAK